MDEEFLNHLFQLELLDKISEEDRKTILKVMDSLLKEAQTASLDKRLR
jgi:hypothetical protein